MSEEERKFLEIVDLKKGFGSGETRQEVLRGMNFSVAKGEFCVLLGPSGSGKSTLLNIIGGIDQADSGYISIGGENAVCLGCDFDGVGSLPEGISDVTDLPKIADRMRERGLGQYIGRLFHSNAREFVSRNF